MRRRRKIEDCELIVEKFLSETERFKSWNDGWFVTWCRMGNGGDPPNHSGPFREDQLYVEFGEFITVYPRAGLQVLSTEEMNSDDLFFAVIFGTLCAFKKSDGDDLGWMYNQDGWHRLGRENEEVRITSSPVQELVRVGL